MKTILASLFIISTIEILFMLLIIMRGYSKYLKTWLVGESIWNSSYDRIRLFVNIMFFGISYIIFHFTLINANDFNISLFHKISFFLVPVTLGLMLYLIKLSWSNKIKIKPIQCEGITNSNPLKEVNFFSKSKDEDPSKKQEIGIPTEIPSSTRQYGNNEINDIQSKICESLKQHTTTYKYFGGTFDYINFSNNQENLINKTLAKNNIVNKIITKEMVEICLQSDYDLTLIETIPRFFHIHLINPTLSS